MASSLSETDAAQQDASWAESTGDETAGEEQIRPSDRPLSDKQVEDPDDSAAADTDVSVSGDLPSHTGAADGSSEYDPGAVVVPAVESASDAEPEAVAAGGSAEPERVPVPAAKKPKAVGGFLVGDSDSEDDEDTPAATATATAAASGQYGSAYTLPQADGQASLNVPVSVREADGNDSYDPSLSTQTTAAGVLTVPIPVPSPSLALAPAPAPQPAVFPSSVPALDAGGRLEARIADEPRGSVDSWLTLISEYRQSNRFDDARSAFRRFLDVFPQAAEVWIDNIEMELELDNFAAAEELFARSLTKVLNVPLWVVYLDYVRRRNNLLGDNAEEARKVVSRAYEFVLDNVGLDKDAGKIWQDYVQFIRSAPGTIGGAGWQDQQKMDQLRKAFRRATCIPISNVNQLWKEYDQFEMGLNKITGRKFLAERSPAYMSAKSANTALENLTRGLSRTTIPRLPPLAGFDGYQEYMAQVDVWKRWIAWERSDPLDLGPDEPEVLKSRILYCYKQALMPLRFWPELWVEAAEWCFAHDVKESGNDKGVDFLVDGIAANPESILLALKHADRIESTYPVEEGDDGKIARGQAVRAPYDKIIQTLRDLHKSLQDREKAELARLEETLAPARAGAQNTDNDDEYGNDDGDEHQGRNGGHPGDDERERKMAFTRQAFAAQMDLVSKCLTHVWIALARAMRRIQGKGSPQGPLGGMRQVFYEARKGGRLKSDIYVAIAKMEWKCYNDKAGGKILERGSKLFPEDAYFMIEYIKYLIAHGDNTNSRVVFETCVNRLAQKPETVHKAKPLLAYMHKREAEYGDLSRVIELEKRMAELYPDDLKLALFSKRFATEKFDPAGARIIISPAAQLRPPRGIMPSVEKPASLRNSPMPGGLSLRQPNSPRMALMAAATNSPKRPFPMDDFDDGNPPRKMLRGGDQREFVRGESPLKGAAGRRLDQQRRLHGQGAGYGAMSSAAAPPAPLPTMVTFLLGQLPPAALYNGMRYAPSGLVQLLRETDIDPNTWEPGRKSASKQARQQFGRHAAGPPGHARQASSDFAHYRGTRNSPTPSGGYRQSSLRPDEAYEPPPPSLGSAPVGYPGQYGAPQPQQYDGGQQWQATAPPAGYGVPSYPQQAPPPPPGQFGGFRYQ